MKKIKTIFVILLILCISVSGLPNEAFAAQRIKLNKKIVRLHIGEMVTLKLKGTTRKPKWSSSNKRIAIVTSEGKIEARSKGTVKVTAKLGKKKYTCKVKVVQYTARDIRYISDREIDYDSVYDEHRLFFSFQPEDQSTRLCASGKIAIKIINDNNEVVYDKIQTFDSSDFSYWTSSVLGTRYVCCIKIPAHAITQGTSTTGKVDFTVTLNTGATFSEGNLFSICNLPVHS